MEWSNEKVLELIDAYHDAPVLWDCVLPGYKNRNMRNDALNQIALLFGVEKVEIERKIKNLLSHFSREVKKEEKSLKSGCGSDNVYKSKWFAYDNMMFLSDRNKPRNTSSDKQVNDEEMNPTDVAEEDKEPEEGEQQSDTTGDTNVSFKLPNSSAKRNRSMNTPILKEAVALMRAIKDNKEERDEYSVFGEHVANKIRKLSNTHAKAMVQHLICNTLFEGEMGKFDQPSMTCGQPQFSQYPTQYDSWRTKYHRQYNSIYYYCI